MSRVTIFGFRVLLWLAPCFAVWYFSSILFIAPIAYAVDQLLSILLTSLLTETAQYGNRLKVLVQLATSHPGATTSGAATAFYAHPLDYCYGIALYSALSIASWGDEKERAIKWIVGVILLLVIAIIGVVSSAVKIIVFDILPKTDVDIGWTAMSYNLAAFSFKSTYLILTPAAPILLWLWQYRGQLVQLTEDVETEPASSKNDAKK